VYCQLTLLLLLGVLQALQQGAAECRHLLALLLLLRVLCCWEQQHVLEAVRL
jgi:hypothetical protein